MAKARRPKTQAIATASDRGMTKTSHAPAATAEDVARRAYDLYLARGREDGHDVEDWFQAERELRGTT
jgi:hypothetical protein